MRTVRVVLLALAAIFGISPRAHAQFSYTIQNFNPFYNPNPGGSYLAGFTADVVYRNINQFGDPQIISFRDFTLYTSQRIHTFCDTYGLTADDCILGGTGNSGTLGSVQTGTIPVGSSYWYYNGHLNEDSCAAACLSRLFWLGSGAGYGVLGCQAPMPTPDEYSGRTCDAAGYTGSLFMTARFAYSADADVPVFEFDQSDLIATGRNIVWAAPNVFVQVTPEPSSWVLMATGLGVIGMLARRRERRPN